jgi:hypothetical protein
MANRYWVGGTGTWDTTDTTNWSTTSGGAGGASVPTAADAVFFDANSGGGTCTLGATVICLTASLAGYTGTMAFGSNKIQCDAGSGTLYTQTGTCSISGTPVVEFIRNVGSTVSFRSISCVSTENNAVSLFVLAGNDNISMSANCVLRDLDFTGFSGTFARGSSSHLIYGDITLSSTMTMTAGTGVIILGSTTGSQTITSNGTVCNVRIDCFSDGCVFADDFVSTKDFRLGRGILNANNNNVTISAFAALSGTKTLVLGSGVWTITGSGTAWNAQTNVANLTVSASTATIDMTSASAKTFAGGGKTWPTLNQGGSGALTIQQANTFADITNTVEPATITFPASTITTVDSFSVSGTSGNLVTLNSSSAGTQATLSDSSGVNSVSFCDIQDINATGGAIWSSFTSNGNVDSGNNTGWDFFAQAFRYLYTRRKNKVIYQY